MIEKDVKKVVFALKNWLSVKKIDFDKRMACGAPVLCSKYRHTSWNVEFLIPNFKFLVFQF